MAFGIYALYRRDPRWNVSEAEASVPAKPLQRMIHRASKRVPMIEATIKVAAEPAMFCTGLGEIVSRRLADNAPAAVPAHAVYTPPAPESSAAAVAPSSNGHVSENELERQRRRLERKRTFTDVS